MVNEIVMKFEMEYEDDPNCHLNWINPIEFLKLTTSDVEKFLNECYPLDEKKWIKTEMPFLHVDYSSGRVIAHEGRHRAGGFIKAGLREYPIVVCLIDLQAIRSYVLDNIEGFISTTIEDIYENNYILGMPRIFLPQNMEI